MEPSRDRKPESKPPMFPGLGKYAGMGLEFGASIVGLTLLGWWVDYRYDTGPVGTVTGAIIGAVGGFYNLIRQGMALNREAEAKRRGNDQPPEPGDQDADRSDQ